ncbi:YfiR family protein [Azoarcus sp. L1K30]|uniref:YfiR family protein n=1 Tax=Azoarcus sp. L1K30 TaxID=2820277 RepID=UPI001B81516C|nr:YfiR family protein [Azoarcus sp. L1K30]MBR0564764.1 YfiR family protein [Azoarcus sp. L1K30]
MFLRLPTLRRRTALLCALASLAAGVSASRAGNDIVAGNQVSRGEAVWGILSYTRWPSDPNPVRLCIVGSTTAAVSIRQSASWLETGRSYVVKDLAPGEAAVQRCDIVYVGNLPPDETSALLQQIVTAPVLSIGEGSEFCSAGGMFCFEDQSGSTRFSANLNAISRSELRINPQVLRLSKRLRPIGS